MLLLGGMINSMLASCQPKENKMEKFDWSHTISAPKGYPMRILRGTLKGLNPGDYSASFGLWGVANEGWGNPSGMVAMGPDLKAIPASLDITWLSLRENKFYKGKFELPREKIIALFKEGFYDYSLRKKDNYTEIIVGMAPGGVLVVWLLGVQTETEVARFQALETVVEARDADSNTEDMFRGDYANFVLDDLGIRRDSIPFGLWDAYREKYIWRPNPVLPKGAKLNEMWITYFNGEKEHRFGDDPKHDESKLRALPMTLNFSYNDESGHLYYGKTIFNEKEIFEAFTKIYRDERSKETELVFELNESKKGLKIHLRSKGEEFEIEKAKSRAFPSTN